MFLHSCYHYSQESTLMMKVGVKHSSSSLSTNGNSHSNATQSVQSSRWNFDPDFSLCNSSLLYSLLLPDHLQLDYYLSSWIIRLLRGSVNRSGSNVIHTNKPLKARASISLHLLTLWQTRTDDKTFITQSEKVVITFIWNKTSVRSPWSDFMVVNHQWDMREQLKGLLSSI